MGAEVLTGKFDQMDQLTAEEDRYMLTSIIVFVLFFKEVDSALPFCVLSKSSVINSTKLFMVHLMTNLLQWMQF